MPSRQNLRPRLVAFGWHLAISAAIVVAAATLVFGLWYPGLYRLMAGGRDLFVLVSIVDLVIGPFLTLVVFDTSKRPSELQRDLGLIGLLQVAALAYGMQTVYAARPVAMVFEVDRFRLITANAVPVDELAQAKTVHRTLPLTGPLLLGTRRPEPGEEQRDALFAGLAGVDIAQRPKFWQPYEKSRADALARSKPLTDLVANRASSAPNLVAQLHAIGADAATGRFVPTVARGTWSAVLDSSGRVLGFVPVDGFL